MFVGVSKIQFEIKKRQSVSKYVRTPGVDDILIFTYLGPDFSILRVLAGDVDEDDDDADSGQDEAEYRANLVRLEPHQQLSMACLVRGRRGRPLQPRTG